MPVTNYDVGVVTLFGTAQIQDGGNTAYSTITFTIIKNCDIEILTPPALAHSDVLYTFHATAVTVTFAETTSSFPSLCPVTHIL